MGEPFESESETVEGASLLRRGEAYGPQSIPDEVQFLTAGIDVQGDRLEVQVIGFGSFEEMFAIRYEVLPGDPAQEHVWQLLDAVLRDKYCTDAGRELRVRVSAIDTGGHHQHAVLTYCKSRRGLNVLPIKGVAGPRPIWPPRASRTKDNSQVFMLGVATAKEVIYSRLRLEKPGPGYVHFPVGGAFDPEYFAQLTSEAVQTRYKEGRPYRIWILPGGKHNEALDTFVYALAARHATRIQVIVPRPTAPPQAPPLTTPLVVEEEPAEAGPIGFDQDSPQADPDRLHQAFAASRQPHNSGIRPPGWIQNGRGRAGGWFDRE